MSMQRGWICVVALVLTAPAPAWAETLDITQEIQTDILTQTPMTDPEEADQVYDEDAEPPTISDPLEQVNRAVYTFNEAFSRMLLRPIARAYVQVVPTGPRAMVGNFLTNLFYPRTIVNDFLQGKFKQGFADTGRFLVNTTIGVVGILDPAEDLGLLQHSEDFGQTLGLWGAKPGPYLVLPLLGPGNARDTMGRFVDYPTSPLTYIHEPEAELAIGAIGAVNVTANLLQLDRMMEESFDPYAFQRQGYTSFREAAIKR